MIEDLYKYGPFDEGVIPIHSIDIPIIDPDKPYELKILNFSVRSQSGDILTVLIPANHISVIQSISSDNKISDIRFYSDTSLFIGEGIIQSVSRIKSGPEKGNYLIELRVK
jgi:hypothetical protein